MTINSLISFDQALLLKINSWHTQFLDQFMWMYSQKFTWVALYVVLVACLIYRYRKNSVWILLAVAVAFGLADWGSHELKYLFMRWRPTHDPIIGQMVNIVNGYTGGKYGFPSSHASDSFAVATLLCLVYKNKIVNYTLIVWALINVYSRMYLGVHFPLDILVGTVMGIMIAILCYLPLYYTKKDEPSTRLNTKINNLSFYSIPLVWLLTLIVICVL